MATAKKPKTFKKVTEIDDAKVTIEVEEKTPIEEAAVEEKPEEQEESDKETVASTGAIAQANAKIQEENEEKVNQSIKDEVNSTNEEADEEDKDDSKNEEEDKKESDDEDTKDKNESIVEETDGMSWKKIFLFAFLAGCIGIFIVGLLMFLNRNFEVSKKTDTNKKIELPKESPTPSPEEVALDAYEIEVLNGSGIAGEAANVEGILEDAGFTVSEIGNANNQNYTNTVIAAKDDIKQGFIDELQDTLEKRGPVEVIKLSETGSDSDVVVTVGSELEEEDANASPTPKLE